MTSTEVTTKNSKNEILEAYHEVLQQLKDLKKASKQELKREQEKQEIINSASQNTTNEIIKNLADLKLSIVNSLEELGNQLLNEHKKLTTLQQAIQLQSKDLEEIYEIKVNIDSLAALLQAQKQKKEMFEKGMSEEREVFEQEMYEKRALWKKEQEDAEQFRKEQEALQKKLRQREEEDYFYKRDLDRKKERDQYEIEKQSLENELADKKTKMEKEFAQREADIIAKEEELRSLRSQVEEFPAKLQKSIEDNDKLITERLQFKYEYETRLTHKEVEGEIKLHQQMIAALEAKIAQQEKQIKELTDKANFAGNQVQEIAVKAIESTSLQRIYHPATIEKSAENIKG